MNQQSHTKRFELGDDVSFVHRKRIMRGDDDAVKVYVPETDRFVTISVELLNQAA